MWPFKRKKPEKKKSIAKRVVAGVIIGGAIGSIVGKKLMEQNGVKDKDEDDVDENGFTKSEV